jgi:hypothetical protein
MNEEAAQSNDIVSGFIWKYEEKQFQTHTTAQDYKLACLDVEANTLSYHYNIGSIWYWKEILPPVSWDKIRKM